MLLLQRGRGLLVALALVDLEGAAILRALDDDVGGRRHDVGELHLLSEHLGILRQFGATPYLGFRHVQLVRFRHHEFGRWLQRRLARDDGRGLVALERGDLLLLLRVGPHAVVHELLVGLALRRSVLTQWHRQLGRIPRISLGGPLLGVQRAVIMSVNAYLLFHFVLRRLLVRLLLRLWWVLVDVLTVLGLRLLAVVRGRLEVVLDLRQLVGGGLPLHRGRICAGVHVCLRGLLLPLRVVVLHDAVVVVTGQLTVLLSLGDGLVVVLLQRADVDEISEHELLDPVSQLRNRDHVLPFIFRQVLALLRVRLVKP
jgi:hypothetical protein